MAHLVRDGRGKYRVRWREGGRGSKQRTSEQMSEAGATAFLESLRDRLAAKKPAEARPSMSLEEVAERWLAERESEGRAKHQYAKDARTALRTIVSARGYTTPASVTSAGLGTLIESHWRVLRAVLRHAVRLGQPVDQQALAYRRPPRRRKPRTELLTAKHVQRLIAAATALDRGCGALAHLLATYGHRPESAVRIRPLDLDLAKGQLRLAVKSGDLISHPLLPETVRLLRPLVAGVAPGAPIFADPRTGKPWADGNAYALWWYRRVGAKIAPDRPGVYELKRYAISRFLSKGLDLITIASITGHRTPAILLRYGRTNQDRQAAALAAISE
jgi:hypothetical protein